jgi:hypothetical protein
VASPHKNRWHTYSNKEKCELIKLHASLVWEDFVRTKMKGFRYWEKNIEIDSISLKSKNHCIVSEIKFSKLNPKKKLELVKNLSAKWNQSNLNKSKLIPQFEVLDIEDLGSINPLTTN